MPARLRQRLTYANVMATVAVFVALGGSSYAAVKLNGKNLKNRSVAATKLKRETLTGTEINEARLGQVPSAARADGASRADTAGRAESAGRADDAAALGGLGPGAFIQGGGASFRNAVSMLQNASNVELVQVPNLGRLAFDCPSAPETNPASIQFDNTSGNDVVMSALRDTGDTGFDANKANVTHGGSATLSIDDEEDGTLAVIQLFGLGQGGFSATVTLAYDPFVTGCTVNAHGVSSR